MEKGTIAERVGRLSPSDRQRLEFVLGLLEQSEIALLGVEKRVLLEIGVGMDAR